MEKKLSLIIALKRRNKNSVFKKKANHLLAKELGISAYLFSRLLKELIAEGSIEECGKYYRIIKFKEIIHEYYETTHLRVGAFNLIQNHKTLKYHEILNDLYSQLIITNVIGPQKYLIQRKKDLSSIYSRTVLNSNRFFKKRNEYRCVDDIIKSVNEDIMVSCRLIAERLSISIDKANKILNSSKLFSRDIKELWIKGIHREKIDKIRRFYPTSIVIPFVKADKYKICFGSKLTNIVSNIPDMS